MRGLTVVKFYMYFKTFCLRFALKSKTKTRRNLQWSSMLFLRLIVYWAKIGEVAMIAIVETMPKFKWRFANDQNSLHSNNVLTSIFSIFKTFNIMTHHTNDCKISRTLRRCIFVTFQHITFKLGKYANLKALFLVVSMDFAQIVHVKSWKKKRGKGCSWIINQIIQPE